MIALTLECRTSHGRICFGVSVFLYAFVKLEVIPHPWTLYNSQFYMKQDKDGGNTSMTKALDKKWQHLQLLSSTCLKEWCQLTFPCLFPLGHLSTVSVCDMLQPFFHCLNFAPNRACMPKGVLAKLGHYSSVATPHTHKPPMLVK